MWPPVLPVRVLGDILAGVFCEHLVDERLIADTSTARLLSERLEHVRIHANGAGATMEREDRSATD